MVAKADKTKSKKGGTSTDRRAKEKNESERPQDEASLLQDGLRVHMSMKRFAKILEVAHENGHGEELISKLKRQKDAVIIHERTLKSLKRFVNSKPKMAEHASLRDVVECDCREGDPFCFC